MRIVAGANRTLPPGRRRPTRTAWHSAPRTRWAARRTPRQATRGGRKGQPEVRSRGAPNSSSKDPLVFHPKPDFTGGDCEKERLLFIRCARLISSLESRSRARVFRTECERLPFIGFDI